MLADDVSLHRRAVRDRHAVHVILGDDLDAPILRQLRQQRLRKVAKNLAGVAAYGTASVDAILLVKPALGARLVEAMGTRERSVARRRFELHVLEADAAQVVFVAGQPRATQGRERVRQDLARMVRVRTRVLDGDAGVRRAEKGPRGVRCCIGLLCRRGSVATRRCGRRSAAASEGSKESARCSWLSAACLPSELATHRTQASAKTRGVPPRLTRV